MNSITQSIQSALFSSVTSGKATGGSPPPPVTSDVKIQTYSNGSSASRQQQVQQLVDSASALLKQSNTHASIEYNKQIDSVVVTLYDGGTVVRTIPSRSFIRMKIALTEMIGVFLNKKA